MLKKFTTFCSIFFLNYIFVTDRTQIENAHCTPGPNSLTTKVAPHIVTEVLGQQTMKFYKNVYEKPIVSPEDFIRRNIEFSTDHTCDLKSKTIIVGANTLHIHEQDASNLFRKVQNYASLPFNNNITFIGDKKVALSTSTEQYVVYNTASRYNLTGYIYTDTAGMILSKEEYKTVNQRYPDCSFHRNSTEEVIYYDVKQSKLLPKAVNYLIPITFKDDKQISGTTDYTNMDLYLEKKLNGYQIIRAKGGFSPHTQELFDLFNKSTHLSFVERLDLSNRLTLSLLYDNRLFTGEIVCILEPSIELKEPFKGNFDSFRKNFSTKLPVSSEPQNNAIAFREFVKDNMGELMPLFKQQEKIYWPTFLDSLL